MHEFMVFGDGIIINRLTLKRVGVLKYYHFSFLPEGCIVNEYPGSEPKRSGREETPSDPRLVQASARHGSLSADLSTQLSLNAQHKIIKPPALKHNKFIWLKMQSTILGLPFFRAD
jgi:hypothetical protein